MMKEFKRKVQIVMLTSNNIVSGMKRKGQVRKVFVFFISFCEKMECDTYQTTLIVLQKA